MIQSTTSHAFKTPKIYSPGYVCKPNVDAGISGVFLKTGGSMQISGGFPRVWVHEVLPDAPVR